MGLHISENGLKLLKSFEGCPTNSKGEVVAYKDIGGVWTIGYGWTGTVNGKKITSGMTITKSKADSLLKQKIVLFEDKVNKYYPKYKWNQNQFDALVCFCWNIGSITHLTASGKRTNEQIADSMLLYNKVNGKPVTGLTNRRKREKALFETPVKKKIEYMYVDTNGANLVCYEKTSLDSKKIGKFSNRTKVTILSKPTKGMFYKVSGKDTLGKSITGYVMKTNLRVEK